MTNARSFTRFARLAMLAGAAAVGLSACGTIGEPGPDGLYVQPIGTAPVTTNATPYTQALVCLGQYARSANLSSPRIAVGRIVDYTGKVEQDGGGAKITQGASLMAMSAFAKAGTRLVERYDTSISEMELKYTNNQLIGEDDASLRQINAGQVAGSDYALVGGITELNYNIQSGGFDIMAGGVAATDGSGLYSRRAFVMNVAMDLRLVDTVTMEVVDVISYQKQIIGRETSAGLFTFFGGNTVSADIGTGEKAMEPIQLAIRTLIERAVLEMSTNLYGAPAGACTYADPLANGYVAPQAAPQQVAAAYPGTQVYAYNQPAVAGGVAAGVAPAGDPYVRSYLRGSY